MLFALCLPIGLLAQSVDDDLYFVPSKDKQEKKETPVKKETKQQVTNIYTSPGTTVVVQDRKGKTRDVDEYNRRYDARDNEFVMDNDTLYIKEKSNPDLDGEWVTGEFDGTQEDYEYAERIIRFRNPRFAISISSPLYWDVVYGPNSWDWNVYTDGMYAYAFPTFSNPLWWDWRYGSTAGVGIMAGAGIVLTTLGDITRVPGAAGMVATGVVGMVVAIGDIITIGTAVLAGAGVVEAIGHATPIRVAVHMLLVDIVLLLLVVQIMVVRKYVGLLAYLLEVVSQRGRVVGSRSEPYVLSIYCSDVSSSRRSTYTRPSSTRSSGTSTAPLPVLVLIIVPSGSSARSSSTYSPSSRRSSSTYNRGSSASPSRTYSRESTRSN